jgi:hypothetical protein
MDMKKYLLMLALSLPLMAQETQEVEVIKKDGKTTVKVDGKEVKGGKVKIVRQHQKGDWNRGDMKRGDMAKRKKMARHMKKKRAIRSAVRVIVIGGLAYYIGYTQGEKSHRGGMKRRPPFAGDKK